MVGMPQLLKGHTAPTQAGLYDIAKPFAATSPSLGMPVGLARRCLDIGSSDMPRTVLGHASNLHSTAGRPGARRRLVP